MHLGVLDHFDELIDDLERELIRSAKVDDLASYYRLRSIPGVGEILSMTILYEVPSFSRFDTVQEFASYSRLVAPRAESCGKLGGSRGRKQGNVHLKWAFSEAAVLLLRGNPRAQKLHSRLVKRYGRAKAISVLAHKIGRAVFHMQKRQMPFDAEDAGASSRISLAMIRRCPSAEPDTNAHGEVHHLNGRPEGTDELLGRRENARGSAASAAL